MGESHKEVLPYFAKIIRKCKIKNVNEKCRFKNKLKMQI